MLDFDDEWGSNDFMGMPQQQQQPPVQQQQQPAPVGSTSKAFVEQAPVQAAFEPVQAQKQQPVQADMGQQMNLGFQDDWGGDGWGQTPMQSFDPPAQTQALQYQQPPVVTQQFQEPVVAQQPDQKEEEVQAQVVKQEQAPVQKQQKGVAIGGSSGVSQWGQQKANQFAQPVHKKRQRKKKNQPKKAPMTSQSPTKQKVETSPVVAPAQAFSSNDGDANTIDELKQQVAQLTQRVLLLEQAKTDVLLGVCTLNSSGEVDGNGYVYWNSNHILKPREQRYSLSEDLTRLVVKTRALYQITFNSSGENPMLIVDGDIYASTHTSQQSSNSVNLFLYLAEGAEISGAVQSKGNKNACEHWLCVRLVS